MENAKNLLLAKARGGYKQKIGSQFKSDPIIYKNLSLKKNEKMPKINLRPRLEASISKKSIPGLGYILLCYNNSAYNQVIGYNIYAY